MITVIPVPAATKPIAKVSASVPVAPVVAPAKPVRLSYRQGKAAAKASKEALLRSLQDAYAAKFKLKLYMDSLAATSQLK